MVQVQVKYQNVRLDLPHITSSGISPELSGMFLKLFKYVRREGSSFLVCLYIFIGYQSIRISRSSGHGQRHRSRTF